MREAFPTHDTGKNYRLRSIEAIFHGKRKVQITGAYEIRILTRVIPNEMKQKLFPGEQEGHLSKGCPLIKLNKFPVTIFKNQIVAELFPHPPAVVEVPITIAEVLGVYRNPKFKEIIVKEGEDGRSKPR